MRVFFSKSIFICAFSLSISLCFAQQMEKNRFSESEYKSKYEYEAKYEYEYEHDNSNEEELTKKQPGTPGEDASIDDYIPFLLLCGISLGYIAIMKQKQLK